MTDVDLLAKKLAQIETFLRELRTEVRSHQILGELRELRFAQHTLQIAIQAALDISSHIVSDERLGEPASNRQLFDLLGRHGWIDAALAVKLQRMAGFRNILVRGYAEVDPRVVKDVVENHLGDLDAFVAAIRTRLGLSPP
jgi:uncharacterized protein YutE (UPF0331/DUF86 family)